MKSYSAAAAVLARRSGHLDWEDISGTHLALLALAIVALVLVVLLVEYARASTKRNRVVHAWGGLDAELRRRHGLVEHLVRVVWASSPRAGHVCGYLMTAQADAAAMRDGPPMSRQEPEARLGHAVGGMFAAARRHPELAASDELAVLRREVAYNEDRIAEHLRCYHDAVRDYNARIAGTVWNFLLRFRRVEPFQIDPPMTRKPVHVRTR